MYAFFPGGSFFMSLCASEFGVFLNGITLSNKIRYCLIKKSPVFELFSLCVFNG